MKWNSVNKSKFNHFTSKVNKLAAVPSVVKNNSLPASGNFCHLLITFANSLDPVQDGQNVGPDQVKTVWHSDGITERFFLNVNFEKEN